MSDVALPSAPTINPAVDTAQLDAYIGRIETALAENKPLTGEQNEVYAALTALLNAEAGAREAFATFYATQALLGMGDGASEDAPLTVPADVARRINEWVSRRQAWDTLIAARFPVAAGQSGTIAVRAPLAPPGKGRLRASLPALLRVPTAQSAREAFAALFAPHAWQSDTQAGVAWAQSGDTTVQFDADEALGLSADQAAQLVAKHGASAAQTFLALVNLYLERATPGEPEAYVTAYASDLLRYQERKETPRGGYHRDDVLAKGRDVYLLSRLSLPRAVAWNTREADEAGEDGADSPNGKAVHIGRLLSVDAIDVAQQEAGEGAVTGQSVAQFRYHLGREVYEWVAGDGPRYAAVSGRLLTFHPIRQKYQILLGFCLACHDAGTKHANAPRQIALPELLKLAGVSVPDRRIVEFLTSIEDALTDLERTGAFPGLKLVRPPDWPELLARRNAREIIARATVTYPQLPDEAPPLESKGNKEKHFVTGKK